MLCACALCARALCARACACSLCRYAEEQQDLALLSISTFQRALKDPNQLIRASALRVLSSIRVPMIVPINMDVMFFTYGAFFYMYGIYLVICDRRCITCNAYYILAKYILPYLVRTRVYMGTTT